MSCRLSWNGKESILYTSIVQQYGTKVADDVLTRINSDQFAAEFGDYKTNAKMDLETIPLDAIGQEPTLDWLKEHQSEMFPSTLKTEEQSETSQQVSTIQDVISKELPAEIGKAVTVVQDVPQDILGRDDLFLSLKEILNDNGINDEVLINWAGANRAKTGDIRNFKSTEQLLKVVEKSLANLKRVENYPELKTNKLAQESFENWKTALKNYSPVFQEIMLSHAIKFLRDPNRRAKFVLQLSPVALTATHGILMNKPHEANRLGKLYDSEVLKTVSDAVGHEPSASGKGYWVHIPRVTRSMSVEYKEDLERVEKMLEQHLESVKNVGKEIPVNTPDGIEDITDLYTQEQFDKTTASLNKRLDDIRAKLAKEPEDNSAQFKVNVELLKKLSPSTWCTASGMASHYVENYDNYLLVVNGITVAGIEAGNKGSNGKIQVKEVTSRNNNGVASIDHLDDTLAFFEKHNLDLNNSTIQNALRAKENSATDSEYNREGDYDPFDWGPPEERYYDPYEDYDPYEVYEANAATINTLEEARTFIFEGNTGNTEFYHALKPEFKADYEIAKFTIEQRPGKIADVAPALPFYLELAKLAMQQDNSLFHYLTDEAKEDPESIALNTEFERERDERQALQVVERQRQLERIATIETLTGLTNDLRDRIYGYSNNELIHTLDRHPDITSAQTFYAQLNNDHLPFSKTNSNKIQGYYDAKNDKIVVVASNTSVKEAARVAIHEVAHRGMIRMAKDLGGTKELNQVLLNSEKELMKKLPELLERTGHKNVEELIKDYGFDVNSEEGKAKLLMELAARWAETLVDKPKPSWWKEFLTSIQNWIKKFTGKVLDENEVNELVGGFVKYGASSSTLQTAEQIYPQLGSKTQSEHVVIVPGITAMNYKEKLPKGSVYSMRLAGNTHFGNPFSHDKALVEKYNLIQTKTTKEAVEKYIDWIQSEITDIKPEQHKWIKENLANVTGKKIVYYKELGEPSHATALDWLANKSHEGTLQAVSPKALEQEIRKVGKPLLSLNLLSDKEIAAVKTDRVQNLKEHNRIKKELELLQKINDCLWH